MFKKFSLLSVILCVFASVGLWQVGCSDDSGEEPEDEVCNDCDNKDPSKPGDEKPVDACQEGDAARCSTQGKAVLVCTAGAWTIGESCEYGCEKAKCLDAPVKSTCKDAGLKDCADNLSTCREKDPDGKTDLLACCDTSFLYCFDANEKLCNPYFYKPNCGDDGQTATICQGGVVTKTACGGGSVCMANDEYADCYDEQSRCEEPGDIKQMCKEPVYYETAVLDYECTTASDGNNYWVYQGGEYCDDGRGKCSEDGSSCVPRPDCDEGYKPNCSEDGVMAQYCFRGKVSRVYCAEGFHEGTCHATATKAYCYTEKDECAKVGDKVTYCRDFYDMDMLFYEETYICEASDNGKNYLVNHPTEDPTCAGRCSEDGLTCDEQGYAE